MPAPLFNPTTAEILPNMEPGWIDTYTPPLERRMQEQQERDYDTLSQQEIDRAAIFLILEAMSFGSFRTCFREAGEQLFSQKLKRS